MNFFIVFQNKTFKDEYSGGYLWAPQEDSGGYTPFHWKNMTKVHRGDVIIS
jgi:hypothetical protein